MTGEALRAASEKLAALQAESRAAEKALREHALSMVYLFNQSHSYEPALITPTQLQLVVRFQLNT